MKRSNAPYEPIYFPDLPEPWRGWFAQFLKFCDVVRIESKDIGTAPLILMASQRYAMEEIFKGFSEGIHDFVIVKARQLGQSTVLWAFDLFWLTKFSIQGMYIADDEGNKELHRDIIGQMYLSLPKDWSRGPWRVNNRIELTWASRQGWNASRLMWAFANKRKEGQLGRSRGANYVHAEEMDSWTDADAPAALEAARSSVHPQRAYFWVGTGQGYGLLYDLWEQAGSSHTSRQIFVGFWRNTEYVITREQRALWAAYGAPPITPDEREWAREVKARYGVQITREQIAWWRWKKQEGKGIHGEEAKALQEYPWLPEQAFQAAGSQFLGATTCLRVQTAAKREAKALAYYRYDWGATFDEKGDEALVSVPKEAATLTVWERAHPHGVYIVAGDPAYGSSPDADRFAVTVWRAFPDCLIQVAEYCTPVGAMYQFAWILAHLAGSYSLGRDAFLIHELNGPGYAVLEELDRMANYGFGLANRGGELQQVVARIQHYLWRKVDALMPSYSREWLMSESRREQAFEKLRDCVERGMLLVRSPALAGELTALRREDGRIEPGGVAHDDLAVTAALAVTQWLDNVIPEIENLVAPSDAGPPADALVREVRSFLGTLRHPAETAPDDVPVAYGVRVRGPGR